MGDQKSQVTVEPAPSLERFIKNFPKGKQLTLHTSALPKFAKGHLDILSDKVDPPKLVHRDPELQGIVSVLMSVSSGSQSRNLFIYGRSGTGKTAAVKHAITQIQQYGGLAVPLTPLYVNCRANVSHHSLIGKLIEDLTKKPPLAANTSWRMLCDQFRTACRRVNANIVIVLDEADGISKTKGDFDSLYFLSNLNSEMGESNTTISVIAVSNDLHYGEELAERVQSRLKVEKLHFAAYNASQLQDILQVRADIVFQDGGLEEGIIPYIASLSAKAHGDARWAIGLLYKAAHIASESGAPQVTMHHVLQARGALETDIVEEGIEKLTLHEKFLLFSVARLTREPPSAGHITMGTLIDGYRRACDQVAMDPMSPTSIARLMADLGEQKLIETGVKSFGRGRGRTTVVRLNVGADVTIRAILKDEIFSSFKDSGG